MTAADSGTLSARADTIRPYDKTEGVSVSPVGGGVHDAPQVLGKVACGVVGRPAHRPPSTYGSAPIDAAGCGHPALRNHKGCVGRVDVGIDPYDKTEGILQAL